MRSQHQLNLAEVLVKKWSRSRMTEQIKIQEDSNY